MSEGSDFFSLGKDFFFLNLFYFGLSVLPCGQQLSWEMASRCSFTFEGLQESKISDERSELCWGRLSPDE